MLSRDCDACSQQQACSKRFKRVAIGEKVYCLDGTAHLVDQDSICIVDRFYENIEAFQ